MGLFGALDTTPEMAEATSDRSWLQALLDFESALARSEALAGLIPQPAAAAIADRARAENFDLEALGRAAPAGGNPVLPLVRALADQLPRGAADWVHWGATSQDAMDSAMMLVAARACPLVLADLRGAAAAAADLAERHRRSVQVGRTLLQQAVPTTFGLKAAGWLAAISEVSETLAEVHERRLAAQLGGAAGTLAALEQRGAEVAANLARELGLAEPLLPWHTDRVRVAQLAAALGLVAGVGAKVAIDVILLSQTEVGELSEAPGPGGGGSSAMPQKRNSAASVAIVAAQRRATPLVAVILGGMGQPLERAAGEWQAEWTTLTQLLRLSGGIARRLRLLLSGLRVDPQRMAANLAQGKGLVMAERLALKLAASRGRGPARQLVSEAAQRSADGSLSLGEELAKDPRLTADLAPQTLEQLLDPEGYLGATEEFIDRALARHQELA